MGASEFDDGSFDELATGKDADIGEEDGPTVDN